MPTPSRMFMAGGYGGRRVVDAALSQAARERAEPKLNGYVAFFNGRRVELRAESLWAAKQAACKEFKVRKAEESLVAVVLAELDGEAVSVNPAAL